MSNLQDNEYFYLVWGENHFDSTVRHSSMADARREADRLALLSPGKRFYVLQAKGYALKVETTWTECRHDPEVPF